MVTGALSVVVVVDVTVGGAAAVGTSASAGWALGVVARSEVRKEVVEAAAAEAVATEAVATEVVAPEAVATKAAK